MGSLGSSKKSHRPPPLPMAPPRGPWVVPPEDVSLRALAAALPQAESGECIGLDNISHRLPRNLSPSILVLMGFFLCFLRL